VVNDVRASFQHGEFDVKNETHVYWSWNRINAAIVLLE
jgi:hypothetical protein